LRYQGNYAAGKNAAINGAFDVWQRGTSISLSNNVQAFTADRFQAVCSFSAGTATVSRQTFTPGSAPVAGYEGQYFWRMTCGSTTTYAEMSQKIENVQTFAGQTMTMSFWAKASGTFTSQPIIIQNFGTGGSSEVVTYPSTFSIGTSWTRYTITVAVPSIAGKTIGASSFLRVYPVTISATLNNATVDVWGLQVEAGSVATAFQTATGTLQGELAACSRYYQKSYGLAATAGAVNDNAGIKAGATGSSVANSGIVIPVTFGVRMRTAPTVTIYAYAGTINTVSDGSGAGLGANSGVAIHLGETGFNVQNQSGSTISPAFSCFMAHYVASAEL
jgi:hypothetical protein